MTEDFGGDSVDAQQWDVYNAPTKRPFPTFGPNVSVGGDELRLTGAVDGPADAAGNPTDVGAGVASHRNMLYGRWEIRMRTDAGAGYSGVATLWPQSGKWPDDHEIDIVELSAPDRNAADYFLHKAPDNTHISQSVHGIDFTRWHTFAVDWEPHRITYYLDGRQTWTVTDPTYIPVKPMHLTLQLDVTCFANSHNCRTSLTPTRLVMHVDWIKIYRPG